LRASLVNTVIASILAVRESLNINSMCLQMKEGRRRVAHIPKPAMLSLMGYVTYKQLLDARTVAAYKHQQPA